MSSHFSSSVCIKWRATKSMESDRIPGTYIHVNPFETIEFALIRLIARQVPVEFDVLEVPETYETG